MIDEARLANTFIELVGIDSESKSEAQLCHFLKQQLAMLGAKTLIDDAGEKIGGNSGNLIAKFKGTGSAPALLLSAHMDTVSPGKGIQAIFANNRFESRGDTILGADDKSAIAIILEVLRTLHTNNETVCPIEVVFSVCEEIGLQGAKNLDFDQITATCGYVLDASDINGIVTRAPAANRLEFTIHGKDAHAGAKPENGINAIVLACQAIAQMKIGRIDQETTCNIGLIDGGRATNIVPDKVSIKGEVRSHQQTKLDTITQDIVSTFQKTVAQFGSRDTALKLPRLEASVTLDFSRTSIAESHPVVQIAQKGANALGRKLKCKSSGGGSDANIFFKHGIHAGVLGTGMRDMHTPREWVNLKDMVQAADLLLEIIRCHSREGAS